jgi:hypothetical protein
MTTYDFQAQLDIGEAFERRLDEWFGVDFHITPATALEQRAGVDRHYVHKKDMREFHIEYKADLKASQTGNAFVETVSVDVDNKPGWAYTSKSDLLFYYLPQEDLVYIIKFPNLRRLLPTWKRRFPTRSVKGGPHYLTWGILVPLAEFERIAHRVVVVGPV